MIKRKDGSSSNTSGARSSIRLALGVAVFWSLGLMLVSCAVMEPPPGGPEDRIRPHLAEMAPDSGSTGLGSEFDRLELTFSEKMDRVSGVTWLHFFPDQRIKSTKWRGATRADIELEEPMPADTVIVVEIAAGMRDAHKVKNRRGRRYPIATGDSIPTGRISGVLVMADSAVTNGVVEMYDVPPDTIEYFQQNLLRRTVTDNTGAYLFDWLPEEGGPWLLRAFADANGDLRPGENEAQRLLPDTLALARPMSEAVAGVTTLYAHNTPGRLSFASFDSTSPFPGRLVAWTMEVTDNDTGWVPIPTTANEANLNWLTPAKESLVAEVKPGLNRMVVFVDVDGDSTFSGVPDSLLGVLPDSVRFVSEDSVATHFLEPWQIVEGLEVDPGLDTVAEMPALEFSFTPWTAPVVIAFPDSLSAASATETDSTATTLDEME